MSLRIVWASPWGERSRVAHAGAAAVAELLARGHQVDVVRTEIGSRLRERPRVTDALVHTWLRADVHDLVRRADGVILNLCDDYAACGAALQDFMALGTLGIIHDRSLHALASGWIRTQPNRRAASKALGDADAWFGSALAGALLHDAANFASIAAACPGPVVLRPADRGTSAYVDTLVHLLTEVIAARPVLLAGLAIGNILASLGCTPESAEVEACASRVTGLLGPV